ncbi:hypothetical protein B0H13DRAFT_1909929 [Mycena leptocephala]|nr:hypothetical protein B0H13DRAFT_1909929 [Mycena leptocephala]
MRAWLGKSARFRRLAAATSESEIVEDSAVPLEAMESVIVILPWADGSGLGISRKLWSPPPSRMLKAGCSQSASSSLAAWQTAVLAELSNGNRRDCNKLYVPQITMIEERTPELGLEPGIFYPRTKPHRDREEAMQKPQNMEAVSRCQLIENTEFEKGNLPRVGG